nr:MAG TPA: hypothetical protein [Bacteriophage sp.]
MLHPTPSRVLFVSVSVPPCPRGSVFTAPSLALFLCLRVQFFLRFYNLLFFSINKSTGSPVLPPRKRQSR